jgi:glutathionylspermidine synthase
LLVKSQGLVYADMPTSSDKVTYWPDDRYYSFTREEIELIKKAGKDVFDMCREAAEYLVKNKDDVLKKMGIPEFALDQVKKSWDRDWGSVYGRFDVCFGGLDNPDPRLRVPKFYEFNADTPTSLVEAANIQWQWLEQIGHGNDQFNSIAKKLIAAWERNLPLIEEHVGHEVTVHFAHSKDPSGEDMMNTMLMMDTCQQAGWSTRSMFMEQVSKGSDGRFYDQHGEHIDVIFKLYPWDWMVQEDFAQACFNDMGRVGGTLWIEPPYKMLWSNKALFAILWEHFQDDPRSKWLLPTYFENEKPASLTRYARKPIFSREGWGVVLEDDGRVIQDETTNMYGKEGYIVQELSLPATFEAGDGTVMHAVPGLWVVDGQAAGVGIREDKGPVTTFFSVFAPHSIEDGPVRYARCPVPSLEEIEASLNVGKGLVAQGVVDIPDCIFDIGNGSNERCTSCAGVGVDVAQETVS